VRNLSVIALAAGCLGGATPCSRIVLRLDAQAPGAATASRYSYTCPAADTIVPVPGVCAALVPAGGGALGSLAITFGPRAGVIAVATGNDALPRVYVTSDSGRHWRFAGLPAGMASAFDAGTTTGRLAIGFDGGGQIHLVVAMIGDTAADLYHISSPDLGATWTRPALVNPGTHGSSFAADFPQLTVAGRRLYATWGYRADYLLHVAWSTDDGTSWTEATDPPTDCINVSNVAIARGAAYVACSGFLENGDLAATTGRNPFTGIRVYRIDSAGRFTLEATLGDFKWVWPQLLASQDGSLVLAARVYHWYSPATKSFDKCCLAMSRSVDGRHWSRAIQIRGALHGVETWGPIGFSAVGLDSLGRLQAILSGSHQPDPGNGHPGNDARLVHAAIDPITGRLVAESDLTPPGYAPQGYYPGSAALAFSRAFGLLLWENGGHLQYTRVEPHPPTSPATRGSVRIPTTTAAGRASERRAAAEDSALSIRPSSFAGTYRFVVLSPTGDSAVVYSRTERFPMRSLRGWTRNDLLVPNQPVTGYELMAVCALTEAALRQAEGEQQVTCHQSVSTEPWRQTADSTIWRGAPQAEIVASIFLEGTAMGPQLDDFNDADHGDSTAYYMPGYWTAFPDGRVRYERIIRQAGKVLFTIRGERISTAVLPGRTRGTHDLW
jgi:hypothetical protein